MIALNSRQTLPANAFWYLALQSIAVAAFLAFIGMLFHLGADSPNVSCRGALCGKLSGNQFAAVLYLLGALLVMRAFLRYKSFSFMLTDKSMSIESGAFVRTSTTFRYDRIQDIDTYRNPLHLMLGLKSVAIWTTSPDQFARNRRRPDGWVVLDVEQADWLKDYLADVSASGASTASGTRQAAAAINSGRQTNMGVTLAIAAFAVVAAAVMPLWITPSPPTAAASGGYTPVTATSSATSAAGSQHAHVRVVPRAGSVVQGSRETYAVACAIRASGGTVESVEPCASLAQARRCAQEANFRSQPTAQPVQLTVTNHSDENVKFYWLDRAGDRVLYYSLPPEGHVIQASHLGAHWLLSTQDDRCLGIFDAATRTIGIF